MGIGAALTRLGTTLWYCAILPTMFVYIGGTLVHG